MYDLLCDIIIGMPSSQPTGYPTGYSPDDPFEWTEVKEPAASGIGHIYNSIQSAAWSSASTVVAVGNVQTTSNGLILRSDTGGLSWTLLSVGDQSSIYLQFT